MVIEDGSGRRLWGGHAYLGIATNNQAEYRALISGLRKVAEWTPEDLLVHMDSELVVKQLNGVYKIKDPTLQSLAAEARKLLNAFPKARLTHVRREKNQGADTLANRAMDEGTGKKPSPAR
jgi:ribonuclease HI